MNLGSFLTGALDKTVDSIGNAFDKLFTSDEQRILANAELTKIKQQAKTELIKLANEYEQSINKRWLSDNEHFVTRLVRPLIVVFLYALFGCIVLTDGNIGEFKINEAYIPVIQTLLVTVTVAYFGSRGLEKVSKIRKKDN